MPQAPVQKEDPCTQTRKARWHLGQATITRPARLVTGQVPEPAAVLRILRELELVVVFMRETRFPRARAAGHSWDAIAEAMGLTVALLRNRIYIRVLDM